MVKAKIAPFGFIFFTEFPHTVAMHMIKNRQSYVVGAAIISAGGFISKVLGAIYRIPLTKFLTSSGMGIYQMVYPLYCILLTVSASGIPTGVARLISSGRGDGCEKRALTLFSVIGIFGSLAMFALAQPIATAVGEAAVADCCKVLAPSVFFVSVISVIRGYFQGKGNMLPTAATEICEQLIKVIFGTFFAYLNRGNISKAVQGAVFAVTISEGITAVAAACMYFKRGEISPLYKPATVSARRILSYTLPLTFTALALPLSQFLESVIAVRLLKAASQDAVALYGVFSGCAMTVVNLPASVTYGFAAAGVPQISPLAANGEIAKAKQKCKNCLLITFAVALPCAAALALFAPLAANILFSSLTQSEKSIFISLVRIMSVNAVTISLMQTSSACLTALGKPLKSTAAQWASSLMRVVLTAVLIKFTPLSVIGAAISANCSYLLAVLLNFCYIISVKTDNVKRGKDYEHNSCGSGNGRRRYFFIRKKGVGQGG